MQGDEKRAFDFQAKGERGFTTSFRSWGAAAHAGRVATAIATRAVLHTARRLQDSPREASKHGAAAFCCTLLALHLLELPAGRAKPIASIAAGPCERQDMCGAAAPSTGSSSPAAKSTANARFSTRAARSPGSARSGSSTPPSAWRTCARAGTIVEGRCRQAGTNWPRRRPSRAATARSSSFRRRKPGKKDALRTLGAGSSSCCCARPYKHPEGIKVSGRTRRRARRRCGPAQFDNTGQPRRAGMLATALSKSWGGPTGPMTRSRARWARWESPRLRAIPPPARAPVACNRPHRLAWSASAFMVVVAHGELRAEGTRSPRASARAA